MAKKKKAAPAKPLTKTQLMAALAEEVGITKAQVAAVFEAMTGQIKQALGKRGPGVMTIPGLIKLRVQRKPATKARPGKNPFTGEDIIIKAKPARNVVKATALKALKDMV